MEVLRKISKVTKIPFVAATDALLDFQEIHIVSFEQQHLLEGAMDPIHKSELVEIFTCRKQTMAKIISLCVFKKSHFYQQRL